MEKVSVMTDTRQDFDERLRSLGRKHNRMTHGFTTRVRGDGLIVVKPKRYPVHRALPLRGLAFLVLGFFAFKGFMLASMGNETYDQRVSRLAGGSVVEQVGAKVMVADPLTVAFADTFGAILRST